MHSALNRAQGVFGFFTTVALFVAGLAALSVLLHPTDAVTTDVKVRDVKVTKGRPHFYSSRREEYAQIRFDLDADLTPLLNWNTKQLFIYIYASYPSDPSSSNPTHSHSIIWDTIIPAPSSPYTIDALRERFFPSSTKKRSTKKTSTSKAPKTGKAAKEATAPHGVLRLRDQKPKYSIGDVSGKMAGRENVTLSVGWNVQPWVGALWWAPASGGVPSTNGQVGVSEAVVLPALKGKNTGSNAAGAGAGTAAGGKVVG
ncbi:signal peptidase 22 kDa subunit [Aspergillus heteromorphus CBS 117.55]|uniref:Signal peptidase subunit 3 n=1 Tax=Aspergillus heteromorphus CBS 117.55 TaxID=1448321 RepID=A0A317W3G2_9EURO|nr:signal peptidase 22 kDa subunit [Aspergillus heteromorphus CBS 117.55]PWY79658.1 signal peptidase 22 kDa subunit [Aspergillus heteromorphus CBS 117.55]